MAVLDVQVVATDHAVWSGEAKSVRGRTRDGDMGILPGHTPVLAALAQGELVIEPVDGPALKATVSGGFFSVDSDQVTIVADDADLINGD
ncbi:MAG: F0F1 ATP synthase subunit epsilon [Nesterenkonia sp.]